MSGRSFWSAIAVLALLVASTAQGALAASGATTSQSTAAVASTTDAATQQSAQQAASYVVVMTADPLALYRGGISGLAATSPEVLGQRKLDITSAASQAYRAYLDAQRADLLSRISTALGRSVTAKATFSYALAGFAADMTPSEASRVSRLPGVRFVQFDEPLELLTDNGPKWMNADAVWSGAAGTAGSKGEGIVVGIIDTGINNDHPSFADIGGDGYDHTNPRGQHYGICAPLNPLICNDKLIGIYDFTGQSGGFDDNGHGSHTASTVAGNVIRNSVLNAPTITLTRSISGVAPHANIISYKACDNIIGCLPSGTISSIDQATADNVDVVNFSIGGSSADPWQNALALSFLGARAGGVFIAASAGNNGPNPATMGQPANSPWTLAVGASTHDRRPTGRVHAAKDNGTPVSYTGMAVNAGVSERPLIDAASIGNLLCNPFSTAQATQIAGKIVVCEQGNIGRVAKGTNVRNGGGAGMILVTQRGGAASVVSDTHVLPTVMISTNDGKALRAWLAGAANARASLEGTTFDESPELADRMAYFSSRGPDPSVPDVIKPDVTAPGVAIWAAFNTPGSLPAATAPEYNVIQGTSMSSPHAAGAAALVRAVNPSWTPAQVHSALVTTAFRSPIGEKETRPVTKEDHATPADAFDMGGGRVDVSRAARAGIALDENAVGYLAANPDLGGDPKRINMPSLGNQDCQATCTWTRVLTSTASSSQAWSVATTAPAGVTLAVSPASFTLAPGASQTITVTATVAASVPFNVWQFGQVTLTSSDASTPAAHIPVALRKKAVVEQTCVIPPTLIGTDAADQVAPQLDIRSAHIAGLFPTLQGVRTPSIEFRIKVQNLSTLLPNVGYKVYFTTPTGTIMWVGMNTWDQVGVKFEYGTNPPGTFTTIGDADEGSYTPDGNIRIVMAANKLGYPEVGEQFTAVSGQVRLLFGAGSTGFISGPADSTTSSSYTFRACAEGPVAFDDTAVTEPGRAVTINVLANDRHTDGAAFALDSITQPANGSAVANANGTVTYTPNSGFRGDDTFTYTIKDAQGRTSTGNVLVAVQSASCAIPMSVVVTDGAELNVAPQHDIREIAMAGVFPTFNGQATPVIKVRMKVATLDPLPPDSHWRVAFAPPGAAANTTYYVQMLRAESGDPRFVYGTLTTSATGTSFSELGDADAGTWSRDGTITWTIATSKVLGPRAGDRLEVVQGSAGVAVPGQLTLNNDTTAINATTRTPAYTLGDCTNVGPVANADMATTSADTPVTIDVLANDSHSTGEPLTVTDVSAPESGTATRNANNTITYAPNAGFTGFDTFTYTITDPQGRSASASVSVTVVPFCPTTSRSYDFESGAEGWRVETAVNDGAPLSQHWQRATDVLAKSGTISFTSDDPNASKDDRLIGPAVQLTAFSRVTFWHRFGFEDGYDGGVLEVSTDGGETWRDVTDPLVGGRFTTGGYTGAISSSDGSAIAGRAAWTGGDGSAATGTMAQTVLDIGSLVGKTALFRWRLVSDALIPGQGWWVDDVTFSGLATDCNEPPSANADTAVTTAGVAVTIAVLANDTDPDGDALTVGRVSDPANGSVTVNADGTITYTPDAGFVGTDTFTYTAFDGEYEDTATVTVTVEERPNTAPVANDDQATTPRNTAVTIAVLANDHDAEGDALTITAFTQPATGRVTQDGSALTYTPAINFSGTETFTYTVDDGHGGADTATVTVRVGEPGAPIACFKHSPRTPEADTNVTFDARCSKDDDTPTDQLTFEWDFQSDGVADATTSQAKHRFGTAGTYTVTLTVRDRGGRTDVVKKTVEVRPATQ